MKVAEAYGRENFGLSFELFPPKTERSERELFRHVDQLIKFKPDFITCTYGAGGTTQEKTLEVVTRIHEEHQVSVAAHLTCVGSTKDQLRRYLHEAAKRGVENIVALRGDPPQGEKEFKPVAGGLRFANELVELIHTEFPDFGVAVAGYPETHQEAPDFQTDLANLKRKVDAGGHIVITQLFYNNDDFFRFRESAESVGIRVPIVPGIMPVTNLAQIKRIASLCGARLPAPFIAELESHSDEPQGQFDIGVEFAAQQAQELIDGGVPGLHFYVLNKSQSTSRVLNAVTFKR